MREGGRKRKLDLKGGGPSKTARTREDVRSILPESVISELQNNPHNSIQPLPNVHEIQCLTTKKKIPSSL